MDNKNLKGIKFPGLDGIYEVPQIDTSLTKSGFAADAKAAGDALAALNRWGAKSVNNTDMNTVKTTGFYYGYTGMTNAAVNTISVWEVIAYSSDWVVQRQTVLDNNGKGETYERRFYGGNKWTAWKTLLSTENLPSGTVGMVEEFEATQKSGTNNNKISKSGNTYTFTTKGNLSKLYTLTVRCIGVNGVEDPDALSSNGWFNSLVVGWKQIVSACTDPDIGAYLMAMPCYNPVSGFEGITISAEYNNSTGNITFRMTSSTWELYHVRGLY